MRTDAPEWARFTVDAPAESQTRLLAAGRVLLYKYSRQREFTVDGASAGPQLDPQDTLAEQLTAFAATSPTRLATQDLAVELDAPGRLTISFDRSRYEEGIAERLPGHLARILRQLTERPDLRVRDVDLLTEEERQQIVVGFNDTRTDYPREATIHGLFSERAAAAPDRPAVVHNGRTLSYRELAARANRLALRLRERGVTVDEPVGLMVGRTPEWVVATLAILQSGGAYLPIDPRYPAQRVGFMLSDSRARLLLTTAELAEGLAERTGFTGEILVLDEVAGEPVDDLADINGPDDLAYVMYTSGTTGRPKGVLVTHRNVVRLVRGASYIELSDETRILQANAIVFDSSTFELWASLLGGGTLCLVDADTLLDAAALGQAISAYGINTLMLTPALFNQLAERDPTLFRPLRYQFVGGDVLSPARINAVREACPQLQIINGYGPTENTTISTCHPITERHGDRIPIGRPISNSTAYVCNTDGQPQPIGVPGELWVGGDGLARGYLDRPELTERAFVISPLDSAGRLYRTGDLARWRPDGTLDFLGRIDDQVKIRGFRIEPGEIEHRLRSHPAVRDAVVLVRERPATGEKYLCGYVVTDATGRQLREHLGQELPDYMIPAYVVPLDDLPLTPSGKLDRAALPEPAGMADSDEYLAARDEIERRLVRVWEDTLGVHPVGVTDDIFDLGVTSLAAAALAAGIQRELGVALPATALLREATIERVAARVRAAGPPEPRLIPRTPDRPRYRLSPQQHQLFVEQSKDVSAVHYNQPIVVELPDDVDTDRLTGALRALVGRHEALRTAFEHVDGAAWQRVEPTAELEVTVTDGAAPAIGEFVRPFDLGRPPLLRAGIHRGPESTWLLLDLHHIASDGVSLTVLLADLDALYAGRPLPDLPALRYVDYAEWTAGEDAARLRQQAEAFWLDVFATPPPALELPTDFPRSPANGLTGSTVSMEIDAARTAALRELAHREGVTLFHLLLAAYQVFLARITGAEDVTVGTPLAGRTRPGLDGVVGMFVNTVCLRGRPLAGQPFTDFLAAVSTQALAAFEHQDYPFDDLVAAVVPARDHSRNPLFDTMFALQPAELHGLTLLGRRVRLADESLGQSMFDLNLHVFEHRDRLTAVWGYRAELFIEKTVLALRDVLLATVDAILADPRARVGELTGRRTAALAATPAEIAFSF